MHSQGEAGLKREFPILFFLLFSLFVAVVYAVLFWWISTVTDRLVVDRTRATARRLVDNYLMEYHLNVWEVDPAKKDLVRSIGEGTQLIDYRAKFLTLGKNTRPDIFTPDSEMERGVVGDLRRQLRKQVEALSSQSGEEDLPSEVPGSLLGDADNIVPVFDERFGEWTDEASAGEYQYYQPVYWKKSCDICHRALQPGSAYTAADEGDAFLQDEVFRVVKVSISGKDLFLSQVMIRSKLILGGLVAYLVTVVGTLLLLIPLGGRRTRIPPAGDQEADYTTAELAE